MKFALTRLDLLTTFLERVLALGDRLGPVRVVYEGPFDGGTLSFVPRLDAGCGRAGLGLPHG